MHGLIRAADNSLNLSDIGLPSAVGFTVRVRNIETENYAFSADITLCHYRHLLTVISEWK